MTHPINELQKLLMGGLTGRKTGKVVRTTDTHVYVAVGDRIKECPRTDATAYVPGTHVSMRGDSIAGRKQGPGKTRKFVV